MNKGRCWDKLRCLFGICKLYTVIVTAGAGYQRAGVTIKATAKDVTVKVCTVCNYMHVSCDEDINVTYKHEPTSS